MSEPLTVPCNCADTPCIREIIEQSWSVWCKRCLTFHPTRIHLGVTIVACPEVEPGTLRVDAPSKLTPPGETA